MMEMVKMTLINGTAALIPTNRKEEVALGKVKDGVKFIAHKKAPTN